MTRLDASNYSDVCIKAKPEFINDFLPILRDEISSENIDLVPSQENGELREPIIIGLVVALGGPSFFKYFVKALSRYLSHKEKMHELEISEKKQILNHFEKIAELKVSLLKHDKKEVELTLDDLIINIANHQKNDSSS